MVVAGVSGCAHVSGFVYIHVCARKVFVAALSDASQTEMCRHLGEHVSLGFLRGCQARPNASRAHRESSLLYLPSPSPYLTCKACGSMGEAHYLTTAQSHTGETYRLFIFCSDLIPKLQQVKRNKHCSLKKGPEGFGCALVSDAAKASKIRQHLFLNIQPIFTHVQGDIIYHIM